MDLTDYRLLHRASTFFASGNERLVSDGDSLFRLLFLFDFRHIAEVGRPVTWASYQVDDHRFSILHQAHAEVFLHEAWKEKDTPAQEWFTRRQLRILSELDLCYRRRGALGLQARYKEFFAELPQGQPISYDRAIPQGAASLRDDYQLILDEARWRRQAVVQLRAESQTTQGE